MSSRSVNAWNYQLGFADGSEPRDYSGKFITGRTCVVAAGHPIFEDNTSDVGSLKVLGITQSLSLNQAKQLQRVYELGSSENVIVPGRSAGTLALTRVWYSGRNLLKALYGNVTDEQLEALLGPVPGYGNVFLNLASGLYDHPFGLLIIATSQGNALTEQDNLLVASVFAENAYLQNYGVTMASQAVVLAEQAVIQYERLIPVDPGSFSIGAGTVEEE